MLIISPIFSEKCRRGGWGGRREVGAGNGIKKRIANEIIELGKQ